jgi:hypothetical protein
MKQLSLLFFVIAPILFWGSHTSSTVHSQQLNSVLGDISFIKKFSHPPTETTDEVLRLTTHLEYVENLLRQKDVTKLPVELRQKRNTLLDLLHTYWTTAVFPRNYDYPTQRMPCFIDKDGRICAVGYLIEKSSGRNVAEEINRSHKYERIFTMNDQAVDGWISQSGLSKEECAMIQPEYGPPPGSTANYISPAYGISSALFGSTNLSLGTINAIQIANGKNSNAVPIIGLLTGAGQVILGAAMFPEDRMGYYGNETNESQKILSIVNICTGTTGMILSAWNLLSDHKAIGTTTSWNVYTFPSKDKNVGLGIAVTQRF